MAALQLSTLRGRGAEQPIITPFSDISVGGVIRGTGTAFSALGSQTWGTANAMNGFPFYLQNPITVKRVFQLNGASATGNFDIGIYDENFNRLVSTGSVAQSGTATHQITDITDTLLKPGLYYMCMASDSSSLTVYTASLTGGPISASQLGGINQASSFPLPATLAPTAANARLPYFGLTQSTVIPFTTY